MDRVDSAKRAAESILNKYHLCTATLDNLINIIDSLGFQIIDFSMSDNPSSINDLIAELHLEMLVESGTAFLYKKGDIKILFVYEQLSIDEKRYALAHELGHICCGHLRDTGTVAVSLEEEYEANEFAHYILNPSNTTRVRLWVRNHRRQTVSMVILAIVILLSIAIIHQIRTESSYLGEYYVTESGEKYHIETCLSLRGRTGVKRLTKEDYESGKYQPCQICLPD